MKLSPQEQVNYLMARMDQLEAEARSTTSILLAFGIIIVVLIGIIYRVTKVTNG